MDRKIKKIKKEVKKTEKDLGGLLKMDKKQDAKIEKCAAKDMGKMKKKSR